MDSLDNIIDLLHCLARWLDLIRMHC